MGAAIAPNGKAFESVWDFPRPPKVERVEWHVRVVHAGAVVVDAPWALRVLETSQPPAYYVAPEHVATERLRPIERRTWCEWKGTATYADVVVDSVAGPVVAPAASWSYPSPTEEYAEIAGHWAFYGGWITANVTGPFKGGPGTSHW